MRRPGVRSTVRRCLVAAAVIVLLASLGGLAAKGPWRAGVSVPARSFLWVTYTPQGRISQMLELSFEPGAIRVTRTTNSSSIPGIINQQSHGRRFVFW